MKINERAKALLIMIGFVMSIVFLGPVSADVEPNSDPMSAESIGMGTHTGSVNELGDDSGDWFKVENIEDKIVKVSVRIMSSNSGETVTVGSYNAYANSPDGQVDLFVNPIDRSDHCTWADSDGLGTMYLYVAGTGDYELKIEYDEGEEDDGGSYCPFVIGAIVLFLAMIIVGAIAANFIRNRNKPPEGQ